MNILLCGNEPYCDGIEAVIYSLLTHNSHCNIYLFTMSLDLDDKERGIIYTHKAVNEKQLKKLHKIVKYLDCDSKLIVKDVRENYDKYLTGSVNELSCFTPYAALRLLVDVELKDVDRILYLDLDTIVQDNLESAYERYTSIDSPYAAYSIPDACDGNGEMVSGVLFFNLEKCKETKFLEHARINYMKNKYKYPDQCALRDAGIKPYPIEESLNYMFPLEDCDYEPKILHFTNKLSPKIYNGRHKFYKRYPQFNYIKEGVELIDEIYFKNN